MSYCYPMDTMIFELYCTYSYLKEKIVSLNDIVKIEYSKRHGHFMLNEPVILHGSLNVDDPLFGDPRIFRQLVINPSSTTRLALVAIATYMYGFMILRLQGDRCAVHNAPPPIERPSKIERLHGDKSYITFRLDGRGEVFTTDPRKRACQRQRNLNGLLGVLSQGESPIVTTEFHTFDGE